MEVLLKYEQRTDVLKMNRTEREPENKSNINYFFVKDSNNLFSIFILVRVDD